MTCTKKEGNFFLPAVATEKHVKNVHVTLGFKTDIHMQLIRYRANFLVL